MYKKNILPPFLDAVFFGGGEFSQNFKTYSKRPIYTLPMLVVKKSGGVMGALF